MRSLYFKILTLGVAFALAGCLVSEEPILDERTGKARPLAPGVYEGCSLTDYNGPEDCVLHDIKIANNGAYHFFDRSEDEGYEIRFRRVARGAYAAQIRTNSDEGYVYYFAQAHEGEFRLKLMACENLKESLREALFESKDLSPDDEKGSTCIVNTVRGLKAAAKAYASGDTINDDGYYVRFTAINSDSSNP